jgi:iron complex outermembrane receptor protein
LSFTFQPSRDVTITPRVLTQKVTADGFNRQEAYNLYANRFTTTVPPVTLQERQQYLLQREYFEDKTTIADATVKIGFDTWDLTSVTTHTDRDILVSRDASALTGSVSVDLGFPAAGVLLPSRLNDTTGFKSFTQELRLSSKGKGPLQWLVGVFFSIPTAIANTPSAWPHRDTMPSPTRASAPAPRWRWPTAFRSIRPTTPTCPTT